MNLIRYKSGEVNLLTPVQVYAQQPTQWRKVRVHKQRAPRVGTFLCVPICPVAPGYHTTMKVATVTNGQGVRL